MKKLTAGIFAGILTIVTVNAARADIATTNYVNQNLDAKVGALSGLETTAKTNTVAAINEVNKAAKDASAAATTAETNAKTYADGLNTAMDARVKANKDAIDVLNGDASVEGSVDYKITEATMDAISDVEAAKKDIEILKGNAEKVGSVDNKIKTAIDGLDERVTANTTSITTLNGADTVEGSVKKQIKDAIATVNTATGELSGRVTANEEAIEALQTDKANAANVYTKTEIDGKVSTINTEIGKKVTATNLQNKLLTTTAAGQLQDASTGLTKPSDCGTNGITCMLVNDGTGFKWEKIVDTYAAN